jgi:hypothetical protein
MISQVFWHNRAVTYFVLTLVFGVFYALNNVLTAPLLLAPGAHLVHLPSGIKFLLVLVFGLIGALSVFTVSLCAALAFYFTGNPALAFELAVANGLAPWLTVCFFKDQGLLQAGLENLNWKILSTMGLMYAVLNSSMNQLLLYWNRVIDNLLDGLQIMFVGDVSGVLLVMGLIRLLLYIYKTKTPG